MDPADGDVAAAMIKMIARGRYGQGDEVAGIGSDLASSETAFVTGTSLKIDGGFTATKKVFSQLE
ncbi:SDR family oxidoreductase [Leptolyngbya sp. FACHB-541]|uniref:SDR family oxidoreductase n=1 Tax=Leptolyngbya sp. FACHB-541 TaxID=2692810 RepID=UPI00168948FE|nr:SDR family oxidoreductase [Leptolyngbya sp. FACHB-541]MBD1995604.1 SDR family oxidoreductase [Leptolyngbya sp. FACHB-541]